MTEFWINMGPQHPMTHGLWNMKVQVDGETVTDAKPEIGYLLRGYEKIMEVREFQKNVVLTDRLCYVSSITWSHAYCLAVEKMMGIETPERGQWIRVVALELQRIASHLMWLAAYGPDPGPLTGLPSAPRGREPFLHLIQPKSRARVNPNYPPGWRGRRLVRPVRLPVQRAAGVLPDHPAGIGEDAEDRCVPREGSAPRGRGGVREDGGLAGRGPLLRDRRRRRPAVPREDPQPGLLHDGRDADHAARQQARRLGRDPRVRGRLRRGDG